jgi:hypothetical protein
MAVAGAVRLPWGWDVRHCATSLAIARDAAGAARLPWGWDGQPDVAGAVRLPWGWNVNARTVAGVRLPWGWNVHKESEVVEPKESQAQPDRLGVGTNSEPKFLTRKKVPRRSPTALGVGTKPSSPTALGLGHNRPCRRRPCCTPGWDGTRDRRRRRSLTALGFGTWRHRSRAFPSRTRAGGVGGVARSPTLLRSG